MLRKDEIAVWICENLKYVRKGSRSSKQLAVKRCSWRLVWIIEDFARRGAVWRVVIGRIE
jgi:hypothetical protein